MLQWVVDLERQCWANAQCSRRECQEIVGIPRSKDDISVEEKVIQVFEKVGCNIDSSNIEACHRSRKGMTELLWSFLGESKGLPTSPISKKESSEIKNGGDWFGWW